MKLSNVISNSYFSEAVLDIFYPKRCIVCNCFINIGKKVSVCARCKSVLNEYGKTVRDNENYFDEAICALPYTDYIKEAMSDFKFRNIRCLDKAFAYAIYNKVNKREFLKDISFICPVPLHPKRDRAYNQSCLIAMHLGKYLDIPVSEDVLIKIRDLTPLSHMGYNMRKFSINSAIEFNHQYNIEGKNICLVDDIYTTGSTANECSRILRMCGAGKVYVLSACYAQDKKEGGNEDADADFIH